MHIQLVYNLTATEFIKSFKRLILRRDKHKIVYSDNTKIAKWLANISKYQKLNDFFSSETILWKFNVAEVPWRDGQFERLIGIIKAILYRTIGKVQLTWTELEEILLDIEIVLNNRPLTNIEEETDYPILTPNSSIFRRDVIIKRCIERVYGKDGNMSI